LSHLHLTSSSLKSSSPHDLGVDATLLEEESSLLFELK
jgi:hypothetical protein